MKIIRQNEDLILDDNITLFDIETTGLSAKSSYVYLIGYMKNEGGKAVLTLLFAENYSEEKELVKTFLDSLKDGNTLVHYNGAGFDIPYINQKIKRHCLGKELCVSETVDLYKYLIKVKKYLSLPNLKLKTVEKAAGYARTDTFDGGELIEVYAELVGMIRLYQITKKQETREKIDALESVILLHNTEDILGLYEVFKKTNFTSAVSGKIAPKIDINSYEVSAYFDVPLFPSVFELSLKNMYIMNSKDSTELVFPILDTELKLFFENYKDYTFVLDKGIALHNSCVSGIAKENKKKCTAKTAYTKTKGRFLYFPLCTSTDTGSLTFFKESYESKDFYVPLNTDEAFLKDYVNEMIKTLCKQ